VLALLGALLASVLREEVRGRALLPLSVAAAATIGIVSFAGGLWIVPLLLPALVLLFHHRGRGTALRQAGAFVALAVLIGIPSLALTGDFWNSAVSPDISGEGLGALVNSLSPRQAFGVWPSGDFQAEPSASTLTNVLIVIVAASLIAGFVWAVRRREWELVIYAGGSLFAAVVVAILGSPWIDAKAFAVVSPAVVVMALVGVLTVPARKFRVAGTVIAGVIAAAVVWSNVLTYHDAEIAPRDRFLELEQIAGIIEGDGPTLLAENDSFASRHFLRKGGLYKGPSDVYGVVVQEPDGFLRLFDPSTSIDTERYRLDALLQYRTIVRRTSAVSSRPSSAYRLAWRGRFYEVWQQRHDQERILTHVALGSGGQPASEPRCRQVLEAARFAGPRGRIATVERPPLTIVPLPDGMRLWLTGSFDRPLELLVDGKPLEKRRREFNAYPNVYVLLGSRRLGAGSHSVELRWHDKGLLHPGTGGHAAFAPSLEGRKFTFGPLALRRDPTDPKVTEVPASRARSLCGKRLDWLEPIGPANVLP
jgi:hypothetical protein